MAPFKHGSVSSQDCSQGMNELRMALVEKGSGGEHLEIFTFQGKTF